MVVAELQTKMGSNTKLMRVYSFKFQLLSKMVELHLQLELGLGAFELKYDLLPSLDFKRGEVYILNY